MTQPDRERKLQEEIDRYRDYVNVHDLPQIYHHWSHYCLLPKLQACGFDTFDAFFVDPIKTQCHRDPAITHTLVSLGAGNCDFEVQLAVNAAAAGVDNLHVHCIELNPQMIERGRALAAEKGFADQFSFEVADLGQWCPTEPVSMCLANHSLHHLVELESLFATVERVLGDGGLFLVNDMVGRNGHMRWPEALRLVETLWQQMPDRYRYNHQLSRMEPTFQNWDCSTEGNEGVRAQDILPLLMEHFHFETFIAFANIIDIFIDRSFGHNFDTENPDDVAFIDSVAALDESSIAAGDIKPTHVMAALRTQPVTSPRHYEHWTPSFCVRTPDEPYRREGA